MAQFKVQVIDEAGHLIANKTVEATDYADACEEVARQARGGGDASSPTTPTDGTPPTGSPLDGADKLDTGFKLG